MGDDEHVVYVCFTCVSVCIPVVFVGEVVYNGGADAGHAPLAVVPSSCDDRELRSTETLLTIYTERGQRIHTHTQKQLTGAVCTTFERGRNTNFCRRTC